MIELRTAPYGAFVRRLALGGLRSIRALDAEAELFLSAYMDAKRAGEAADLPFFQAATCLQLAVYNLSQQGRERIDAMLDEGLRIL